MSQAIASARNRRAFNTPNTTVPVSAPSSQGQAQPNVNTQGLTLPQVIALVDKRLITLETFMKETKTQPVATSDDNITLTNSIPIPEILDEFNSRFEILAQELETIKDVVLKLQSYTMEVNKMLVDERVHVFSELGNHSSNLTGERSITIDREIAIDNSSQRESTSMDLRGLVSEELQSTLSSL
jgi:hypothetical protein|uniref:Uncharacterized protein n=1 Tax=viral metagenome TaxID=1070528 RepID=A0A6C0DQP1_9ZZZZ